MGCASSPVSVSRIFFLFNFFILFRVGIILANEFHSCLLKVSDVIMARALEVEEAVFQHFGGRVTSGYREKLRSLYMNLKNKSNPQLRVQVVAGEILASRIVTMTSDELKSAKRREEDVKLQQENMNKAMVAQVEKSVSTALTCGKCGQKKVSYSQAQTRSADEPMTTFCECQVCGNRWKVSFFLFYKILIFIKSRGSRCLMFDL